MNPAVVSIGVQVPMNDSLEAMFAVAHDVMSVPGSDCWAPARLQPVAFTGTGNGGLSQRHRRRKSNDVDQRALQCSAMARKSEVYTWRVSPSVKAGLEEAARNTNRSVARLLDEIVAERLGATAQTREADMEHQRRLHARAARFAGRFSGTDPLRSAKAKARIRARLTERRVRAR